MSSIFNEIVQRAENLNTDVRLGNISHFRHPFVSSATSEASPSLLDERLDDIFRCSEEIWSHKQSLRPIATVGMSPSLRTSKDLSQLSSTRLPVPEKIAPTLPQKIGDYEGISTDMADGQLPDQETDNYVQKAFERARIENEHNFMNQQILQRPQSASTKITFSPRRRDLAVLEKSTKLGLKHFSSLTNVPLAHEQNIFAQKVDKSLSTDVNALLTEAMKEAIKKLDSKEVDYIWSKVFSILPKAPLLRSGETVRELRSSKRWLDHIIDTGLQYLQYELEDLMESTIETNLAKARRGGIPGTLTRIGAFLNLKNLSGHSFEDGSHGKHPIWIVLFYCLRLGDALSASEVAKQLRNNAQCSTLVGILAILPNQINIDEERRIKLRAEWKQNAQSCQDLHKKAVYGLFLGFDCPEVNITIEDWLWAKLFSCKYSIESTRSLRQLQTTIYAQHGEKYFAGDGGSHLLYFSVLLLTGQIERAVQVLFKSEHRVHSIHIGIFSQQLRLLLVTDKVSDEILVTDVHEANICQLNLARIVLLYVKDFELTNIRHAINYCFFLRDFKMDEISDSQDRSVFDAYISRIVFITGEREAILGQLNQRGEKIGGLIDRFEPTVSVPSVVARVAHDTNVQGDPLTACHLYALANRAEDAIKLINYQLSLCIVKPKADETLKAVDCAEWLKHRYESRYIEEESGALSTLSLLLKLHTFFRLASEGKHQQAVNLVREEFKLLPTDPEDVQACVAHFPEVPEEIRNFLSDLCTQLMRCIVSLHQSELPNSSSISILKQFAKAIILYTAMIPYRFSVSTNSLLLQLQSKIV